jgi:hypothetical protein
MPKGLRDAPPASQGRYAAPATTECEVNPPAPKGRMDALPAMPGQYAAPATPGRDDKSAIKSPISESASTVRKISQQCPLLGPQQIDSLMKSQYGKKLGKPPASFAKVLEQDREETPTPIETPPSAQSTNSSKFELLSARRLMTEGAGSLASRASTPSVTDPEVPFTTRLKDALLSPSSRMAKIRAIADSVRQHSGEDDDLLDALQLTFDKERLKNVFPRRIITLMSPDGVGQDRVTVSSTSDYVSHLSSMMMQTCDTLNEFLRAAGSERTFSYGSSKYYKEQNFEEVLYRDWPAQTIALNLEKRLLERIMTAYRAISLFMTNTDFVPGKGMPRPASPAFTDNSAFAQRVALTLAGDTPAITSPRQEDTNWASQLEDDIHATQQQVSSETLEGPLVELNFGEPLARAVSRA